MTDESAENTGRPKRVPAKVAIIMDGKGRWARRRGLHRGHGQIEGAKSVTSVLKESLVTEGLTHLTLFALGRDNLRRRPKGELDGLFPVEFRGTCHGGAFLKTGLQRLLYTYGQNG